MQKEKMLKGEIYNPFEDKTLTLERENCKKLCYEFNHTKIEDKEKRIELIKKILGKTKENFWIEPFFWCDYGYNIQIGKNFYANHNLTILDPAKVIFGDNVFIGPNCGFYTAEHPLNPKMRNQGLEWAKEIVVKDNVWFGGNVTVLSGTTIGNNCTIGAGSVVTKDIPDNSVAVGCPARVIKKINEENI
ncbi:sugar O-acetyltransferase [bacterium]|nr:sugar O-acetyltransferase [bacterium]